MNASATLNQDLPQHPYTNLTDQKQLPNHPLSQQDTLSPLNNLNGGPQIIQSQESLEV